MEGTDVFVECGSLICFFLNAVEKKMYTCIHMYRLTRTDRPTVFILPVHDECETMGHIHYRLVRGTIVNGTYSMHENLYI